ncbi:MAG: response regulator [Proteobacteria bacterium]|nr:response regulator [Pseudomonadota bacterium]
MISITKRAEEELVSIIKAIKVGLNANSGSALHIRGLALGDTLFNQLPHLLDKWIGDPNGKIFVCEDRDIFIFSNLLTPKFYARFREMLHSELGYEPTGENTVTALYDCHTHILALEAIASDKLEKKIEQRAREEEKRKAAALNAHANAELITTLARRRNARRAMQILVIEDDPFSRRMIGLALSPDFEATFADSGISGLRDYVALAPDILFLDINLPDISGHGILQKIIKIDPEAHVVMLSGNGNAENVMKSIDAGAKGFVGKPFARDKLLQCIKKSTAFNVKKKEA